MHALKTLLCLAFLTPVFGQNTQWIEGFSQVKSHLRGRIQTGRDFRGSAPGYFTAAWWSPEQLKNNSLSWETGIVPANQQTTFAFIAATSLLPSEYSRGPEAKLLVNGRYALTFTIGFTRDMTWSEGEYQLKYLSKRVEYPFFGAHRQFELNGNSGIYQLSVPASAVEAGKPAVLQVELQPFAGWSHGWFAIKARKDVLKDSLEIAQGEIEALRQDMAMVNQQTQILASQIYRDLVDKRKFEHQVIYTNGFRHEHPADLIKLQNGDLMIMFREGTEHISIDGDVVMLRSKDGGKTWGDRQVIADIPNLDEREGCGLQLKDGTIVVGIFYNAAYHPDGTYMTVAERKNHIATSKKPWAGTYMITSEDNGHTWSKPYHIDTSDMPYISVEGPTDAPIEMPDGSIVMGIIGKDNHSSSLIRSTDKGKTWKHVAVMASDPDGKLGGFMEPGLVRTKTGRLVTAMRNHAADHAIWVTHSDDDGKTWSPVKKTAMIGHPVDLIELADGRLMATYGLRRYFHPTPGGVRACFCSDNGETWDIQTEVAIRNDFPNWDVGYPESLQMPDGRVLTVYYYNLFNKYYIGGTTWTP